MVVRIRLARFGKKRDPIYNIIVAQARTARDSKPMEVLGTYDPLPKVPLASADTTEGVVPRKFKDIRLDTSRTKYWLGVGAQPSDSVWRLLSLIGLVEPKPGRPIGRTSEPYKRERPPSSELLQALEAQKAARNTTELPSDATVNPKPESPPVEGLDAGEPQMVEEALNMPGGSALQTLQRDSAQPKEQSRGDSDAFLKRQGGFV